MERQLTPLDRIIMQLDDALRLTTGQAPEASRPNPAQDVPDTQLDNATQQHVAGLMRVNHSGEICAQALYAGQALTAHNAQVREAMTRAAQEELDHLAWCELRLQELDSRPSLLNPLWWLGSFAIGAAAGLAGDGWSLGFLRETENQVEAHLEEHLGRLPATDARSQAILGQMQVDEASHAQTAAEAGAYELPTPVREAMRFASGIMKAVAYRL
jgi:ubiquinone biosynthesis monooxygenase Coq7